MILKTRHVSASLILDRDKTALEIKHLINILIKFSLQYQEAKKFQPRNHLLLDL